jgi:hypothetical protein
VATARRAGSRFSVTVRHTMAVTSALASIEQAAWVPIRHREAIWDDQDQRWVCEAEVAEIGFTAFTGRRRGEQVTARLIVRRVRRLDPTPPRPDTARKASCSPPTPTTRSSPTRRCRCSTPSPPTATTPSSSRSSPT